MGDLGSIPGLGRSSGEGNWLPTPVFWPGGLHGQRSLAGYSSCGRKESDTMSALTFTLLSISKLKAYRKRRQENSPCRPNSIVMSIHLSEGVLLC